MRHELGLTCYSMFVDCEQEPGGGGNEAQITLPIFNKCDTRQRTLIPMSRIKHKPSLSHIVSIKKWLMMVVERRLRENIAALSQMSPLCCRLPHMMTSLNLLPGT